ncbi:MAG: hypothetical protein ACK41D_01825 [Rubricoccaceae bacterium]
MLAACAASGCTGAAEASSPLERRVAASLEEALAASQRALVALRFQTDDVDRATGVVVLALSRHNADARTGGQSPEALRFTLQLTALSENSTAITLRPEGGTQYAGQAGTAHARAALDEIERLLQGRPDP